MNVAKEANMPHKRWKLLLTFWAMSLALTLFTLAPDSNAQEILEPYAPPILHSFLDSANVYPESVTVDQSSGTFFVGSVKEGTIYKGKVARPSLGPSCLTNMDILLLNGRAVLKFQSCYLKDTLKVQR